MGLLVSTWSTSGAASPEEARADLAAAIAAIDGPPVVPAAAMGLAVPPPCSNPAAWLEGGGISRPTLML